MLTKTQRMKTVHFISGILFGFVLCLIIISTMTKAVAEEPQTSVLGYTIYVNGDTVKLNEALIKDGRTYVQLRELCNQLNVEVDWINPARHALPVPGGNLPGGINLTNPTFAYTDEVTNYYDTTQKIKGVEITGIYRKYQTGNNLRYTFVDEGIAVKINGSEKVIPLKYNPSNGRMYVSVNEFREKIQPYLVDICMQTK